jgi:DNA-binding MarR family transcriptional regulator
VACQRRPSFRSRRCLSFATAACAFNLQRAARALARRFDDALRPLGMTSGQFSMMMALNRPEPPSIGSVAALLSMDRTTLTAALKPLQRRELVLVDAGDRRGRRLELTPAGRALLACTVPVWRHTHATVDRLLPPDGADRLRQACRHCVDRTPRRPNVAPRCDAQPPRIPQPLEP